MSQIQIRQVPFSTSTDAQRVVGSWFPTGYYGHFRARSRAELCNYFRQLARPNPPKKFVDRQTAEATKHLFSIHDNRFKFESDPLVRETQTGFGKKKSKTNIRGEFDPLFVSWVPKNVDRKTFVDDPKISSYADDFNRETISPHVLSDVQSTEVKISNLNDENCSKNSPTEISVYSTVYKHGQPDKEQSKQIRRETFERFLTTRTRLLQQKGHQRSSSVASCLVWNNSDDEKKSSITNDQTINVFVPIKLEPRVLTEINTNLSTSRQRVQSAGPRLMSTGFHQSSPVQQQFQSQSMQMFKTTISTEDRPQTATTTSREHFKGANFGLKIAPPPRATTSFEQTHTNSMDTLISKYM